MLIDKATKIKIVKEHLNYGITLKELKEKYGISNNHIKMSRKGNCLDNSPTETFLVD